METHKNQRLRYSKDVRSVHSGGNLNNGSQAGVSSRNSNNGLGNSNSNNGYLKQENKLLLWEILLMKLKTKINK